jgi:hypothetical protein
MEVQYRNPDITITDKEIVLAKANNQGILEVIASSGPVPPGGETLYAPTAYTAETNVAGPVALTKLYVGLNSPLVGSGPFYVVVVDSAGPLVSTVDLSVIATPPLTAAGDFFYWEPPGGAQFVNGISVAISSTPLLYTATSELCAVSLWTVP